MNSLLNNQKISISRCMLSFAVALLQFYTQHKINCYLFFWLAKNWSFIHCGGHVSSNCHSCTSLFFWPSLMCHIFCIHIFLIIKYNYGFLVLSCYIFCPYIEQWDHGMHCRSVPPSRTYWMPSSGISAGTPLSQIFHTALASAGLSSSWSKRDKSKRAGGQLHNSYLKVNSRPSDDCMTVVGLWKRSSGSIWILSPSI